MVSWSNRECRHLLVGGPPRAAITRPPPRSRLRRRRRAILRNPDELGMDPIARGRSRRWPGRLAPRAPRRTEQWASAPRICFDGTGLRSSAPRQAVATGKCCDPARLPVIVAHRRAEPTTQRTPPTTPIAASLCLGVERRMSPITTRLYKPGLSSIPDNPRRCPAVNRAGSGGWCR
jgi:hypothetical protein